MSSSQSALTQALPFLEPRTIAGFFLVLARLSPLFLLAPLFSSNVIPARVRGIAAVALAVGLTPVTLETVREVPLDAFGLGGLIAKELLVGAGFAYAIGAVFAALQVAGAFLDTLIGFGYGGILDPVTGTQSAVITQLYGLIGTLIFIAIGGDAWVLRGLAHTYEVVGITEVPSIALVVDHAVEAFTGIFAGAIQVAGPVVLALILTDAAFGVVSRVVPQLNVFAVGFPAKVVVGLLLIAATLPFVAQWFADRVPQAVG